jgi:hypothetical protein
MDSITESLLMDKLGPAPSVKQVSKFLGECVSTTWARINRGDLTVVKGGRGANRVTLRSLCRLLTEENKPTPSAKRGRYARSVAKEVLA